MKNKTIYWGIGILAVIGVGVYGYKQGWFGENTSGAAGTITGNPNKKKLKCIEKCIRRHPNWSWAQCNEACKEGIDKIDEVTTQATNHSSKY